MNLFILSPFICISVDCLYYTIIKADFYICTINSKLNYFLNAFITKPNPKPIIANTYPNIKLLKTIPNVFPIINPPILNHSILSSLSFSISTPSALSIEKSNKTANFFKLSISGIVSPVSHLEIVCLATFSCSASYSCVIFFCFLFCSIISFNSKISPPI